MIELGSGGRPNGRWWGLVVAASLLGFVALGAPHAQASERAAIGVELRAKPKLRVAAIKSCVKSIGATSTTMESAGDEFDALHSLAAPLAGTNYDDYLLQRLSTNEAEMTRLFALANQELDRMQAVASQLKNGSNKGALKVWPAAQAGAYSLADVFARTSNEFSESVRDVEYRMETRGIQDSLGVAQRLQETLDQIQKSMSDLSMSLARAIR